MNPLPPVVARRAYTLVEMVLASAVASVILLGSAAAVVVASKAIPDRPGADREEAAVHQLVEELSFATAVLSRSATSIEFTSPSKTGLADDDTIRYEWSGTPGDALLRTQNPAQGGTPQPVLDAVKDLSLRYDLRTVSTSEMRNTTSQSPEVLLARFDGWTDLSPTTRAFAASSVRHFAEYFRVDQVALPPTTSRLQFTRVRLQVRYSTHTGDFSVAIHQPQVAGKPEPAPTSVGSAAVRSSVGLPGTFAWTDFPLPADVLVAGPLTEFVIVVRGLNATATDQTVGVKYLDSLLGPLDAYPTAVWTQDAGASWNPGVLVRNQNDAPFEVFGTYETTQEEEVVTNTHFLRGVGIQLTADSLTFSASAPVHNQPEVPAP